MSTKQWCVAFKRERKKGENLKWFRKEDLFNFLSKEDSSPKRPQGTKHIIHPKRNKNRFNWKSLVMYSRTLRHMTTATVRYGAADNSPKGPTKMVLSKRKETRMILSALELLHNRIDKNTYDNNFRRYGASYSSLKWPRIWFIHPKRDKDRTILTENHYSHI